LYFQTEKLQHFSDS